MRSRLPGFDHRTSEQRAQEYMTARGFALLGIEVLSNRAGVVERAYRAKDLGHSALPGQAHRTSRLQGPVTRKRQDRPHSGNHKTLLHRRETIKTARGWT